MALIRSASNIYSDPPLKTALSPLLRKTKQIFYYAMPLFVGENANDSFMFSRCLGCAGADPGGGPWGPKPPACRNGVLGREGLAGADGA